MAQQNIVTNIDDVLKSIKSSFKANSFDEFCNYFNYNFDDPSFIVTLLEKTKETIKSKFSKKNQTYQNPFRNLINTYNALRDGGSLIDKHSFASHFVLMQNNANSLSYLKFSYDKYSGTIDKTLRESNGFSQKYSVVDANDENKYMSAHYKKAIVVNDETRKEYLQGILDPR